VRATTLDYLGEHRRARVGALTDRLVDTIVAGNPGYRAVRVVPLADLRASCHDNLTRVLELLRAAVAEGTVAPPGEAAYDAARATGRRRAEQGLPLDDVLRSFRMGGRLVWEDLVDRAPASLGAADVREIGTRLWEVIDETSAQVAAAYHAAEQVAVRADEQLRAALWESLLGGRAADPGFAHEAARLLDVPVDGRYLVVLADALDPVRVEEALLPQASVWVRRTGGVAGLLPVGEAPHAPVLRTLRRYADAPVAVSGPVTGLAGVGAGVRQASLALRTLGGAAGLASFDDRLPEALLLTAPDVAERLVETWLGPVLELPRPERDALLGTLEAWVATGGSPTHTAARVHCHRNTVLNRLRRVASLLGRADLGEVPPVELALALRSRGAGVRH
jgi:hypothetical protein